MPRTLTPKRVPSLPPDDDHRLHILAFDRRDLEADSAVSRRDHVALDQALVERAVGEVRGFEDEFLSGGQRDRVIDIVGSNLVSRKVKEDLDAARQIPLETQDHVLNVVERAVRAVDTRYVHAGRVQARKRYLITRLRANRADETSTNGCNSSPPR